MKASQKNWLSPNNRKFCFIKNKMSFLLILFFSFKITNAQITNYVTNGGFENLSDLNNPFAEYKAIGWTCVDSLKICAPLLNKDFGNVPLSGSGYQMPKSGKGYVRTTLYCPSCPSNFTRGNIKNRLKQNLIAGTTYCVKMYVNVEDVAPRGIDAIGLYFGDNTIDTIKYYALLPITFITPQIQNPIANIIIDTMNWIPITGTFVANGTEKFMLVANFKSDVATNTAVANSTATGTFSEYYIDDISCIDINLPAYAGPDIWGIPTNTVYLGRPQDVGIDEACMWYHLPNTTTAIDTAAGITLTVAATTQTYMVKQDICGNIKYDTVVVYASGTGLVSSSAVENSVKLYPNPVNDILNIEFSLGQENNFNAVVIYNSLGQIIREEEILIKNKSASIKANDLPNGVYLLQLSFTDSSSGWNDSVRSLSKRFVINR